jgi:two-component system chemotaxis sensor kinase CheA
VDELEAIKITFFQECEELLTDLENGLLALQGGDRDPETINAVFRAVHSVKGGAGAFGFETLVRFAHVFETLLDGIRSQKIQLTPEIVVELLRAADILADLVRAAQSGDQADESRTAVIAGILEAITEGRPIASVPETDALPAVGGSIGAVAAEVPMDDEEDFGFQPMTVSLHPVTNETGTLVNFVPKQNFFRNANEPLLFLRELGRLANSRVQVNTSQLPSLESLDPELSYLSWTIEMDGDVHEASIRDVFDFVDDDCEVTLSPLEAPAVEFDLSAILAAAKEPAPAPLAPPTAAVAEPEPGVAETPAIQAPAPVTPPKSAANLAKPDIKVPPQDTQAFAPQATIRVDPERIDRLIDLVGELVINQAMLAQRVSECGFAPSSAVSMGLDELEQLTREIQEGVMAIRAQPVRSVFQRMPRLVRETASMVGKQVRLATEGEGTEVDKTVIERLSDPITHMIRNAIDHGLESTEERLAAGKPAEGLVRLAALHRGGRIVIEVSDDGKGIDRKRVRAKAIERELISADTQLSDEEIDNLIFLPGFSTAAQVSDVSGRGVGMDVVRRSIQALGGRISIVSKPGEGSTFTLSLPLTLAVLDGMVIDVGGHTLVIPLTVIVESVRPRPEDVRSLGPTGSVLAVRGGFVPMIDIGTALGYRNTPPPASEGVVLLIENEDGGRAALVADAIQGQRQVVIKSLEANYQQVEGIAAATILGDGRVALILDTDAVVAMRRRESRIPDPSLIAAE